MTITQETANLVDTLAHAASQIGSTPASAKINSLIVSLIPDTEDQAAIIDDLREDLKFAENQLAIEREKTEGVTYISKQHTTCASCGQDKHTPLRVDHMGGYVCLTCIDGELDRLFALTAVPVPADPAADEPDDDVAF